MDLFTNPSNLLWVYIKKNIKRPDGGEGLVQGGVPFQELLDSHWIFEKGPTNQLFLLGKKKKKNNLQEVASPLQETIHKKSPLPIILELIGDDFLPIWSFRVNFFAFNQEEPKERKGRKKKRK